MLLQLNELGIKRLKLAKNRIDAGNQLIQRCCLLLNFARSIKLQLCLGCRFAGIGQLETGIIQILLYA